jgi:hypothetical protein
VLQVGALLNQLQELLRRAEVERDRAKLQLKRQRVRRLALPVSAAVCVQMSCGGDVLVASFVCFRTLQLLCGTVLAPTISGSCEFLNDHASCCL